MFHGSLPVQLDSPGVSQIQPGYLCSDPYPEQSTLNLKGLGLLQVLTTKLIEFFI